MSDAAAQGSPDQPGLVPAGPDQASPVPASPDQAGPVPASSGPLLRTVGLTKHFKIGSALSRLTLHAVDDVSLDIGEREIVALAGESGSGKSTIARLLAKLYKPTSGEIYFQGQPVSRRRSRAETLRYTGLVPMVFQDPFSSINPVLRISHGVLPRPQAAPAGTVGGAAARRGGTGLRGGGADPGE